jgi:hypothetical protein
MAAKAVWKRLGQPKFGLADIVSDEIAREEWLHPGLLTDIRRGKELLLACDFGGSHKSSQYDSFAFLAGCIGESGDWDEMRRAVRNKFLSDGRRMSFKRLGDTLRARSLVPFLRAADLYPGVLVTILVDKKIKTLIGDHRNPDFFPELIVAEKGWTKKGFHRLCLIASVGALLVAGLSEPSQDTLWVTDQDDIAANSYKHDHAGWVIWHHIRTYDPKKQGEVVFITTEGDNEERRLEDVVAIADLAAGALAQAMSLAKDKGRIPGSQIAVDLSEEVPEKSAIILAWLGGQGFPLRRVSLVIEPTEDGHVKAKIVRPNLVSGSVCPFNPSGSVGRVLILD